MASRLHPIIPRPAFALWLFHRRLTTRCAAVEFGVTHEHIRLICLPFDSPGRRTPSPALQQRILAYTRGEIGPDAWAAPDQAEHRERAA